MFQERPTRGAGAKDGTRRGGQLSPAASRRLLCAGCTQLHLGFKLRQGHVLYVGIAGGVAATKGASEQRGAGPLEALANSSRQAGMPPANT